MSRTEERVRTAIAEQASEWFVTHRAGPLSQPQREAFVAWLKQSPEHIREYLAVVATSRDLGVVAGHVDADLQTMIERARRDPSENVVALAGVDDETIRRRISGRFVRYAFAAALGTIAIGLGVWALRDTGSFGVLNDFETRHGEQRVWQLSDGSVVHLNSGSRIEVRFSDSERLVDLERGQALFKVARDTARAFRVISGDAEVVAIGTEFDVYRRPHEVIVTVAEGRVSVEAQPTAQALQISAGKRVRVSLTGAPASADFTPEAVDVRKALAWVHREIVFDQQPLAEVTEEFNRYGRVPIDIEDTELRALRVSGVFNAYDTESFVDFLRRLDEVEVETAPERIRVRLRTVNPPTEPMSATR